MTEYDTTCVEWDDGWHPADCGSAPAAAAFHAEEGWDNANTPEDERTPVTIRVQSWGDRPEASEWTVSWVDGRAVAARAGADR